MNAADLAVWKSSFGPAAVPGAGAVPEPASAAMAVLALGALLANVRRK